MADDKGSIFAFVFPHQLEIVISDPQTHKQILTLYNPYHFPIKFKGFLKGITLIKATESFKKVVKQYINWQYSSSLKYGRLLIDEHMNGNSIVRYATLQSQTCPSLEKFRIEIYSVHNQKISGSVDVPVHILETAPKFNYARYHQLLSTSSTDHSVHEIADSAQPSSFLRAHFDVTSPLVMVCVGAVAVCAIALMLPTEGLDVSKVVPNWLHLSVHLKLVFAYILGLVTLVLLRPG